MVVRQAHNLEAGGSSPPPATNFKIMIESDISTEKRVAAIEICWTKEYGLFHFLKGNRDLNQGKINKLMKSVQGGLDLFRYCPIMVNEKYYVIDGQHRFYVCKKLGLNIYYVVVPDMSLRQIAEMNSNASRWKDRDFLNCYIDTGIEDYKILADFIEKYHVNIGSAIRLLENGSASTGGTSKDEFKNGMFRATEIDAATRIMEHSKELSEFTAFWNKRSFIKAVRVLLENGKYNHTDFIEKLRKYNLVIERRSEYKDYLVLMEELFNHRNQKRITIY